MTVRLPHALLTTLTAALLFGSPLAAATIQDAPAGNGSERRQDDDRPRRGAGQDRGQNRGGRQMDSSRIVARMMQSDTNGDGRISRDEIGEGRFAGMFEEVDTDKDGYLTEKEITVFLTSRRPGAQRGARPNAPAEEAKPPVDGKAMFDEGMAEAGRALRGLRRTPMDQTSFTQDLLGAIKLQDGLFKAKSWFKQVPMSDAAKEKFGSDEQAYSRSFQLHMARTMVTSFQLEIAILEGDSDKAKELVKAMVIERNSGHDLFEN